MEGGISTEGGEDQEDGLLRTDLPVRGWTFKSLGMKGPWSRSPPESGNERTMHPAAHLDSSCHQSPGGSGGWSHCSAAAWHQKPAGFISLH